MSVPPRTADDPPPSAVSAIVINYNGRRFLDELLAGLLGQTHPPFETLLYDNASTDGSAQYVRDNFHRVRVVETGENLGFSRAANRAARQARGEFLALLNPDIKLEADWLAQLVEAARADPEVAAVACKLRLYHKPDLLNGVGGAMNRLGYTWDIGMFETDRGQYDAPREVLFASAGAALFRRSAWLEAGGFDERFFMYHEDVDLGWRLWLRGFRVVTAPAAVAFHHFGGSTGAEQGFGWREVMGERHNMRALLKNYEPANALRALMELLSLRQPPRRKLAQMKNFAWNLLLLPDTLRQRWRIQSGRRRSDSELKRLIVDRKDVPIRL